MVTLDKATAKGIRVVRTGLDDEGRRIFFVRRGCTEGDKAPHIVTWNDESLFCSCREGVKGKLCHHALVAADAISQEARRVEEWVNECYRSDAAKHKRTA